MPSNDESRPVKAAHANPARSTDSLAEATAELSYTDHFSSRVIQSALTEALRSTWLRRAEAFEAARHRPGIDFPGAATVEQLRTRWLDLTEKAATCRNHATVAKFQDHGTISAHLMEAS